MKRLIFAALMAIASSAYAQQETFILTQTPVCGSSTEGQVGIVIPAVAFTCFNSTDVFRSGTDSGIFVCCNVAGFDLNLADDEVQPYQCYNTYETILKTGENTYRYAFTCQTSNDGQLGGPNGYFTLTFTASYTQTHVIRGRWPFVTTTWTVEPSSVLLTLNTL